MSDYVGIVTKIDTVQPIEGADRIQIAYVLGEPVIVSKELDVGYVGIFFPPDTQLSEKFLSNNNLYRNSDNNSDKNQKGFFEENGRVRAQPFLGVKSCGYFTSLESLSYTGFDYSTLQLGNRIEEINGDVIAKKYINPRTKKAQGNANTKARKKVETPLFHEHVDTDQFKYHAERIPVGAIVSIQAKAHGTSGRASHTLVKRPLKWYQRWLNKLYPFFSGEAWEYVTGTRRVVLKSQDADKDGFHGSEAFRFEILEQLKPHLERGVTVYYEILGYANGKPIMGTHDVTKLKDKAFTDKYGKTITYNYGNRTDQYSFFVYRVTLTTPDGQEVDLTQPQLKHWCETRGIPSTLDLVEPFVYDGNVFELRKLVEQLTERDDVLTEDYRDANHISEGVIVRVDGQNLIPKFYKNKSRAFRILEGIFKEDNVDLEDAS